MISPSQARIYVSSAVGGSLAEISFEGSEPGNRVATNRGGGVRGNIKEFSRSSRRNLLRRLAVIDRAAFRAYDGRLFFVTLTYGNQYSEDPKVCKGHLKALRKRLARRFGRVCGFWRMGIQQRGALHFHLLLFLPRSAYKSPKELRRFIGSAWHEICGEVSEGHLVAGTQVAEVRTWRKATSCAERYVAKEEEFPEGLEPGRVWGVWNETFLPVRWETVEVSLKDTFRVRRVFRRLAGMRSSGSVRRLIVFVRHANVLRLLHFLGYSPP